MTSIRIHEDKENQNAAIRHKDDTMAGQPRRTALGVLDNNKIRDKQPKKNKQRPQIPLPHTSIVTDDKENCNGNTNGGEKRLVIPVAQFEAFKVYEDNMKITGGRPVMPDVDEFYKHSNALVTKKDLMIMTFGEEKKKLTAREFNQILRNRRTNLDDSSESVFEDEPSNEDKPKENVESPMNVSFIEKTPKDDIQMKEECREAKSTKDLFFEVEEYRTDIYQYLRQRELQNRPKPGYMKKQPDITYQMRSVLVDWLVEVAAEYKMGSETWYLAVNLIDRFLSYMSVVRAKLQLVGTAAIFIAAKYEEIYTPDIKEYVYITADTYCQRQIIRMEQLILKILNFDISVPTPYTFINSLCSMLKISEAEKHLALYICELSALETDPYIETLPSILAASAIAVARYTLDKEMWPKEFVNITKYEVNHLKQAIEFLSQVHNKAPDHPQRAIPEKYAQLAYNHVSQIKAKPLITLTEDCSTK